MSGGRDGSREVVQVRDGRREGLFIVFEGGDSVGKTTQVRLLVEALQLAGIDHIVTFEPGDTWLGQRIRNMVLDPASGQISPLAEVLLFSADKAQHVTQVVRPALDRRQVVVCDRYIDSMIAYQGGGRVQADDELESVARWATGGLRPDLTILLDADPKATLRKIAAKDRLESAGLEFHQRVRATFLRLADRDPEHYLVVEALTGRQGIAKQIRDRLVRQLGLTELEALGDTLPTVSKLNYKGESRVLPTRTAGQ